MKLFLHKSVVFFRHVANYSLLCTVFHGFDKQLVVER